MDGLLTPVSTTYTTPRIQAVSNRAFAGTSATLNKTSVVIENPEDAIQVLKSEPDYKTLISILKYLCQSKTAPAPDSFSISNPSPEAAQITQTLVAEIAPNYWPLLKEEPKTSDAALFLFSLRCVAGINAILVRLRALIQEAKSEQSGPRRPDLGLNIKILLETLSSVLDHNALKSMHGEIFASVQNPSRRRPLTQEFISVLAGGRIISVAAEAHSLCQDTEAKYWISDGQAYSRWLGQSIARWVGESTAEEDLESCAELFSRSMGLGYSHVMTTQLFEMLVFEKSGNVTPFTRLLHKTKSLDQRKILLALLKYLTTKFFDKLDPKTPPSAPVIPAAAGLIEKIVGRDSSGTSHLISWLTSSSGAGIGDGIAVRRAVLAALSSDKETIATIFEKSIAQFGDDLYIRHAPILQQEAHAQVLLLSAGYVQKSSPVKLAMLLRSRTYLRAVSNRIAATQPRTRFLGMVVGEALSSVVHGEEKKLDFHLDEMDTDEAKWYKQLVRIVDSVGPIDCLLSDAKPQTIGAAIDSSKPKPKVKPKAKPIPKKALATTPKPIIQVINSDGSDDDISSYPKPDSDPEDSDDDPTLINRDKPKAPVYIRDLIIYLRDTENYDKQRLALNTAPALIRRKANFGSEVAEHAEELATLLIGLQDKFEMDEFYDLRLQGMVAIAIAQPKAIAPWFARTFFEGDYSVSQRASVLAVLGLSGRELAGFSISEFSSQAAFPSKKLPEKVEKLYLQDAPLSSSATGVSAIDNFPSSSSNLKALPPSALDTIGHSLTATFLAPIAAEAADSVTGPSTLKLSSFKQKTKPRPKVRKIPNTTANLLYTSFFAPLIGRLQHVLRSPSSLASNQLTQPYLLSLVLKTLTVLLHAAGPSSISLSQMTTEYWDLLLAVRAHTVGELSVAGALLAGFAALLDVNENDFHSLVERHGREVVETQEWVGAVLRNLRGGDRGSEEGVAGEENDVKMLAAGILIRLHEIVDRYQQLLMGNLMGV